MKKFKILSFLMFMLIFKSAFGQQNFIVNNPSALSGMMSQAINYASNTGNTGTVILDVGSLISLNGPLPVLNHTNGKVVIKNVVGSNAEGVTTGAYSGWAFKIGSTADVEISGITIKDFNNGINIYEPNVMTQNEKIDILNNTFERCGHAIKATFLGDIAEAYDINIIGNDINGIGMGSGNGIVFDLLLYGNWASGNNGLNVMIDGNDISDTGGAIRVLNVETTYLNTGNFKFRNNVINNCRFGIHCLRPKDDWEIKGNSFNNINRGISMDHHGVDTPYPNSFTHNFEFSEGITNDLNEVTNIVEAFVHGSNTYIGYSYFVAGMDDVDFTNIQSVTNDGSICLPLVNTGSVVTNCLITNPNDILQCGYDGYPEAILGNGYINGVSAVLNGTDITVTYDLLNINTALGDHRIEFYMSNDDGSLLDFLGSEIISSFPGPYSKTFTGVNLSGNAIALHATPVAATGNTSCVLQIPIDGLPDLCEGCENSFQPMPEERYWVSAWVKVDYQGTQVKSYNIPTLSFDFLGTSTSTIEFHTSGDLIEGWQRIVGEFTMPQGVNYLGIGLNPHPTLNTYFDDIRIHPFNSSMKSYVYDGDTFWLVSELDDNNYATIYEYDEEGGLIRIKKETERGIVTIQETRSNTVKQQP